MKNWRRSWFALQTDLQRAEKEISRLKLQIAQRDASRWRWKKLCDNQKATLRAIKEASERGLDAGCQT